MTILENCTLGVIMAIEAEKAGRNDHPTYTLVVHDNLAYRVEKAMGLPAHPHEITSALTRLEKEGHIVMGQTINDIYVKPKHTSLWQQGEYNLRELLDGRNKALRAVAIARAIESQYTIEYVPHPELPKTWIAKRVARKDGKPLKHK